MLFTVEVIRKNGAFTAKDKYPFCGKSIQEVCNKLDSRIKNEGNRIDKLPFNSINVLFENVVMAHRYESQHWN
jgi:hypothetical protein